MASSNEGKSAPLEASSATVASPQASPAWDGAAYHGDNGKIADKRNSAGKGGKHAKAVASLKVHSEKDTGSSSSATMPAQYLPWQWANVQIAWLQMHATQPHGYLVRAGAVMLFEVADAFATIVLYIRIFFGCSANYFVSRGLDLDMFSFLFLLPIVVSFVTFVSRAMYFIYMWKFRFAGNFYPAIKSYVRMSSVANDKWNFVVGILIVKAAFESLFEAYVLAYINIFAIGQPNSVFLTRIFVSVMVSIISPAITFHNLAISPVLSRSPKMSTNLKRLIAMGSLVFLGSLLIGPLIWMLFYGQQVIFKGKHAKDTVVVYDVQYFVTRQQCTNASWASIPDGSTTPISADGQASTIIGPMSRFMAMLDLTNVTDTCGSLHQNTSSSSNTFSCMPLHALFDLGAYSNTVMLSGAMVASIPVDCTVTHLPGAHVNLSLSAVLSTKCIPST